MLTLILAGCATLALAQQQADEWIGRRVIQRHNNYPLRLDGQAVMRSGMEIHIYKVERRDGDKLWLEGDDDGPSGWAAIDQLVRIEDAIAYLADRIRVHPDDAFYHALRAAVFFDRHDLDRALDDWNKIVELEPDDAASFIGRAKLSLARMEWDRAINDLPRDS
jgi:tetratricopeptide (TPR) repeat protein